MNAVTVTYQDATAALAASDSYWLASHIKEVVPFAWNVAVAIW